MAISEDQLRRARFDIYSELISADPPEWDVFVRVKPSKSKSFYPSTVVRFQRMGRGLREIRFVDGGAGQRTALTNKAEAHLIDHIRRNSGRH